MFDMKEFEAAQQERRNGLEFWRKFREKQATVLDLHSHLMNGQSQLALVDMLEDMTVDEIASFMIMAFSDLSGLPQHQMQIDDEVSFMVEINGKEYYTTCSKSEFDESKAVEMAANFHLAGGTWSGTLLSVLYADGEFVDYTDGA